MSTSLRTETGDLALPRVVVTDPDQVALQTVIDTFALWQGEWFLDQSVGFPWGQQVFGVVIVSTAQVENLITAALLAIASIATVVARSTFNRTARSFAYVFTAKLNSGATIQGGSSLPTTLTPAGSA